jgi:uncharacterized protein (TIGR02246 family)
LLRVTTSRTRSEHANAALVRRLYQAFEARDRAAVSSLLADDCRWIIPGRGRQAGVYEGRAAVIELFRTITRKTRGTTELDVDVVIAGDDYAIVLQRGRARIDGRSAELDECLVYRIRDGQVVEMKEFQFDLYALDEWWNPERAA